MAKRLKRRSVWLVPGLAFVGGTLIGALFVAFEVRLRVAPVAMDEQTAAEAIDMRFPIRWMEAAAGSPGLAESSSGPSIQAAMGAQPPDWADATLFDPAPVYAVAPDEAPAADEDMPTSALPTKRGLAGTARPWTSMPGATRRRPNAVLSDAQIASIKRRLNLTPDQQRYWPAVEAELRKMEYRKDAKAGASHTATVDMSKVNVKAGLPLVMSFNDEQKQELHSLAHLLGLEDTVASR
jgi:hypothetical protein